MKAAGVTLALIAAVAFAPAASAQDAAGACVSDGNADGTVNVVDVLGLLGAFGATSGQSLTDYDSNADGAVNVSDLLTMLGFFGASAGGDSWGSCAGSGGTDYPIGTHSKLVGSQRASRFLGPCARTAGLTTVIVQTGSSRATTP